jgi:hypothetical protein
MVTNMLVAACPARRKGSARRALTASKRNRPGPVRLDIVGQAREGSCINARAMGPTVCSDGESKSATAVGDGRPISL